MNMGESYKISVDVRTQYIVEQSIPEKDHYVFAYTITIHNLCSQGVKLLGRKWHIMDANGHTQDVEGVGVVGLQPYINPQKQFEYTSGAILATPVGSMQGSYQFAADDGAVFEADIPPFRLADPNMLH